MFRAGCLGEEKAKGPVECRALPQVRVKAKPLAVTYFPGGSPRKYRRRWSVSLPCSGWERVDPLRSNHQEPLQLLYDAGAGAVNGGLISQDLWYRAIASLGVSMLMPM